MSAIAALRLRSQAARQREAVIELLAKNLSPLQAKIRRRRLPDLAKRIIARESDSELFFGQSEAMRAVATILHARHVAADLEREHAELELRFRRFVRSYEAIGSARGRKRFLAEHLSKQAHSWRRRRGDLGALDRELDLGALRERHDAKRHELLVGIELALEFIGHATTFVLDGEEADEARTLLVGSDLFGFVVDQLRGSPRSQTRLVAGRSAHALARLDPHASPQTLDALDARAADPDEHPWVQIAAFDTLACLAPERARALLEHRLEQSMAGHRLDFLARRLLVDRLRANATFPPLVEPDGALDRLRTLDPSREPSPHVRIGVVDALASRVSGQPQALVALRQVMRGPDRPGDPVPVVRGHAIRHIIRIALARLDDDEDVVAPFLELVRATFESEQESFPLRLGCEELRRAIDERTHRAVPEDHLPRLRAIQAALGMLLDNPRCGSGVHESAAAASEALNRLFDPRRQTLMQRIRTALHETPTTKRTSIRLDPVDLDDPDLRWRIGRSLAELTRDDWGIDATLEGRRLVLRKGDRFATRLWRILHEIRTPAPNKRQGFRHTVGRVASGNLRAHSGRLDEVTPTVVPGERVHVGAEASWGRHLPPPDDLLGLPLFGSRPVEIFSSFGRTRLRMTGSFARRLWSRLAIVARYSKIAIQRNASLASSDPDERRRYAELLSKRYGIEISMEPPPSAVELPRALPERAQSLMPPALPPAEGGGGSSLTRSAALVPLPALPQPDQWLDLHAHYFLSMSANDQHALASFLLGMFALFFGDSFRRRRRIDRARTAIPLSIGGWGTRGKSGTERIKAGLLHGLGYQVFSKTTGCEAMFIHSVPEGPSSEVFVFRPYGKATIWEQRNLLELGANLGADVFLWECMALNPKYVEILQHEWMRDDLTTLTNAYPDHEDVQGPAGINVAEVISRFIPKRGTCITSELNFLPLFRDVAARQESRLIPIDEFEGELIAPDLLELFPYQEHPRNIALVARMAEELGIDREFAIMTMAQHVVPDLGVLKTYPQVRVEGRRVEFINGCSANERAGFMANWLRTGCSDLAHSDDPEEVVITVVNNRDDRISRSEVFARILVNDTVVDRHVLIGTNLRGLHGYIRDALEVFLEGLELVRPKDLDSAEGRSRIAERVDALTRRLRIIEPVWEAHRRALEIYARGAGLELESEDRLRSAFEDALASDGPLDLPSVRTKLTGVLRPVVERAFVPSSDPEASGPAEVLAPCTASAFAEHVVRQVARSVIRVRLGRRASLVGRQGGPSPETLSSEVREAYRALFADMLVTVEDPQTKGDAIVQIAARSVPPGTRLRIMGTQNIKGTGLDFVYRWLALGTIHDELQLVGSGDLNARMGAWQRIEAFADHGMMDLGVLDDFCARYEAPDPEEATIVSRIHREVQSERRAKLAKLEDDGSSSSKRNSGLDKVLGWVEGWLDFLDGARRFHEARQLMDDLVHQRISHARAAVRMRDIYAREKGGWLAKRVLGKRG